MNEHKGGHQSCEASFRTRGLYPNDLEHDLDKFLENTFKSLVERIEKADTHVILERSDVDLIRKYVLVQMMRTPSGLNSLSQRLDRESTLYFKMFDEDDDSPLDAEWFRLLDIMVRTKWSDLKQKEEVNINKFHDSIDCLFPAIIRTDTPLILPDTGLIEMSFDLDEKYRPYNDVARRRFEGYLSRDLSDKEAEELSQTMLFSGLLGLPISEHMMILMADQLLPLLPKLVRGNPDPTGTPMHPMGEFIPLPIIRYANGETVCNGPYGYDAEHIHDPKDSFHIPIIPVPDEIAYFLNIASINQAMRYVGFSNDDKIIPMVHRYIDWGKGKRDLSFFDEVDFSKTFNDNKSATSRKHKEEEGQGSDCN